MDGETEGEEMGKSERGRLAKGEERGKTVEKE
jgi:hypothetical protein